MIERFLELREYINDIINRHATAPIMITAREIQEMYLVKNILQPLETATKEISEQKYTTSSIVIPIVHNLEQAIDATVVCTEDEGLKIASSLKTALLK